MKKTRKSSIPGLDTINVFHLENHVTVLSYPNMNSQSVYMIGILKGSGDQDPPGKTGLAHFAASLLSRGTRNISFADFHYQLESAGASLAFSCGSQHAWFRGKALAEDIELLFNLTSDSIQNPAFNPEYINRLRNQLITGLTIRNQDTSEIASILLDKHLFPDHPYGQPIDGFIKTIQSITRSDISKFHADYYAPKDLTIVVVGAVDTQKIHNLSIKYFSSWKDKSSQMNKIIPLPTPPNGITRKHKSIDGKSQVDLLMGCFGPSRTSDDYVPTYIGNNILGQFGLMGRIGKSVRSKAGLAYYASSSISAWADVGTWGFSAGVNADNVEKVIDLMRKEIGNFVNHPVTEEELDNSKSHLIGRMPMALESNGGLANAILTMHRFNLGLDYYQKYEKRIQSVNAEQILYSSQKYLTPDDLIIASAGPGKDIK